MTPTSKTREKIDRDRSVASCHHARPYACHWLLGPSFRMYKSYGMDGYGGEMRAGYKYDRRSSGTSFSHSLPSDGWKDGCPRSSVRCGTGRSERLRLRDSRRRELTKLELELELEQREHRTIACDAHNHPPLRFRVSSFDRQSHASQTSFHGPSKPTLRSQFRFPFPAQARRALESGCRALRRGLKHITNKSKSAEVDFNNE
jgi:hypothetical protein